MDKRLLPLLWLAAALLPLGCGELRPLGGQVATISHTVRPGDTLYSIAWHYGYDYRQVAAWNGIQPPYRIFIGQRLQLIAPHRYDGTVPEERVAGTQSLEGEASRVVENAAPEPQTASLAWRWPTEGRLVETFALQQGRKGVDIGGAEGQAVYAAAGGQVVYSGGGLIGYGNLVIIKHDNAFLSAYAHNRKLLVKEGERVDVGQQIAEMGQSARGGSILHFEIRRNGKPVDPLYYLPKQRL